MDLNQRWEGALEVYRRKIRTAAANSFYVVPGSNIEDMEQELLVVLWECCEMYEPLRGASFSSFFWMRARQRIGQLRNKAHTKKRFAEVVSLDQESVAWAAEQVKMEYSAEEEFLAWLTLEERVLGSPSTRKGIRNDERAAAVS